ncbi:cytochrome c oxidase subunit 3 [Litoribrevibacter euphylliae]|uniref:cytochrome-c oxidase n=1 Tax=Litoribrevibacter euphylliae TaxID=1834034 RepID=A0ABV7H721_9GAMM
MSQTHNPAKPPNYYVPHQSKWPIIATIAVFCLMYGLASILHSSQVGKMTPVPSWIMLIGLGLTIYMLYGWFSNVIQESRQGLYSAQLDQSFRMGMAWFIFSEVMFFAAFFGALFYARVLSVPWLGGEGDKGVSNMLWEGFSAHWPLLTNPDPELFPGPSDTIPAWQIPFLNTVILVSSSFTLTLAHHALKEDKRKLCASWLAVTVALGVIFLGFQIYEYQHAYNDLQLTLSSGIYGSTFFMLTGFHGAHVTIGTIMLAVVLIRILNGHFTKDKHFGFEASAWYWHFVDVVWLLLFTFVYVL